MSGTKSVKLASVAIISLLAMPAFVGEANAAAKAFSSLAVQNFIISDGNGQLSTTDFDVLEIGNTSQNAATLDGTGPATSAGPVVGNADALQACVGTGCPVGGENNFNQQTFPPPNTFARGDSALIGAGITGVPNTQSHVDANTVAETQVLEANRPGTGSSTVGTDTRFSFSLTATGTLTFSFSAQGLLHLILDPGSGPGSTTGADFGFSIVIRDVNDNIVFQWTPNGAVGPITGGTETLDGADLTQNLSLLSPGEASVVAGLANFQATTNPLAANQTFTLTIAHKSFARAIFQVGQQVPEPSSLALLSFGLLAVGLFAMPRRRNNGGTA